MRVYYEIHPSTLGRVMYRIRDALMARKPTGVLRARGEADVQVIDVIGPGALEFLGRGREYVIMQHCWTTSWRGIDFWKPIWDKARLVVSYHDLPYDRYLRIPWGADFEFFRAQERVVKYGVMTTGYDEYQEAIVEPIAASNRFGWPGVQVGNPLSERRLWVDHRSDVSDDEMRRLYSQSAWVAAMRWGEGFELPAVEGLACGARPICFDTPGYRHWFGDHAVYVEERREGLVDRIAEAMGSGPRPVSAEERTELEQTFGWNVIAKKFWEAVLR